MKLKLNNFTLLNYLYYSYWITKWLKLLLITGKKETAENYTNKLFKYIKIQYGLYPYFLFNDFLVKNKLGVIIKQYRKSNIFYEVPFPMDIERQYKQSMRWILITVRTQRKVSFQSTLLSEITDFLKEKTSLLQKRNSEQLQILVKSRLYQQYRW
jgi:ribosomal protein S7